MSGYYSVENELMALKDLYHYKRIKSQEVKQREKNATDQSLCQRIQVSTGFGLDCDECLKRSQAEKKHSEKRFIISCCHTRSKEITEKFGT